MNVVTADNYSCESDTPGLKPFTAKIVCYFLKNLNDYFIYKNLVHDFVMLMYSLSYIIIIWMPLKTYLEFPAASKTTAMQIAILLVMA